MGNGQPVTATKLKSKFHSSILLLELVRVMVLVEHVLKPLQLPLLFLGVSLLVSRITGEGQRVVRILRVLFMENIIFSIVPVGEARVVARGLRDGLGRLDDLVDFGRGALALLPPKLRLVRRA